MGAGVVFLEYRRSHNFQWFKENGYHRVHVSNCYTPLGEPMINKKMWGDILNLLNRVNFIGKIRRMHWNIYLGRIHMKVFMLFGFLSMVVNDCKYYLTSALKQSLLTTTMFGKHLCDPLVNIIHGLNEWFLMLSIGNFVISHGLVSLF